MTTRQFILASLVLLLACAVTAWFALLRLDVAVRRAHEAAQAAERVEHDARRLESLRAARPRVGEGAEPQADALALVTTALADATLPSTHLRSLLPDAHPTTSERPGDHVPAGYQRRTLRLTLGGLALPNLGAFLRSWRGIQDIWDVTHISLRREPSPRASDPDRWTATMTLTATYLGDPASGVTP